MNAIALQSLFDVALERFGAGDVAAARGNCERILAQTPGEAQAVLLLGMCYAQEGRLQTGEEQVRLALSLDPSMQKAQHALAEITKARESVRASPYFREYMLSRSRYRDFPRNIAIETVGRCNAVCTFCPQPGLARKTVTMSDSLFAKIINDLREIPEYHPLNIFPNGVNDPFMDRQIFPRLALINAELPRATLHIFTNLNVVHRDFFEHIAPIRNIRALNVSFNAATRVEYERVMGIDFDRTVKNLRNFMAFNREHHVVSSPLILSRVSDLTATDAEFAAGCQELFSDYTAGEDYVVNVKQRADWLGRMSTSASAIPFAYPCGSWFDINIFCTGIVPHCCMDGHADYPVGDVNKSSVLEIYNGPAFRKYRETLTSRETAHPCNTCSLMQ
jgi:sulfatase maturation enzyme AslB (radical SAM superfamily)